MDTHGFIEIVKNKNLHKRQNCAQKTKNNKIKKRKQTVS